MNSTAARVGVYLVGLAVVFVAALGLGSAVGPVGPAADQPSSPAPDGVGGGMNMGSDRSTTVGQYRFFERENQ